MRVRSPIGLDLGGRSPEETALSILAEIVADRHGGTGELGAGGVDQAAFLVVDGVVRNMGQARGDGAVAGKGKGLDLDLGLLPGIDEADVLVLQEGLDF